MAKLVTMLVRREAIIPFPRQKLVPLAGGFHRVATAPLVLLPPGPPNILVPLLRFVCSPAIENILLVKIALGGIDRAPATGFVSAALMRQIAFGDLVDPQVPIEAEFAVLEPLTLDCGFVCAVRKEVG